MPQRDFHAVAPATPSFTIAEEATVAVRTQVLRAGRAALVRAVGYPMLDLPSWPDLTDRSSDTTLAVSRTEWLRALWDAEGFAEGLQLASSGLARQVTALCEAENPAPRDVRRAALSVARYLLRSQSRATPFGLFAGVTTASFEPNPRARWGTGHRAVVAASAEWLTEVIARLESFPELLGRLPVVANTTLTTRGDRLIVSYQPHPKEHGTGAVEIAIRYTAPVSAALEAACVPIQVADLAAKILAEFPDAGPAKAARLITELVSRRALITSLHAPGTETDALGYLVAQLKSVDAGAVEEAAELVEALREIHAKLTSCSGRPVHETRAVREAVADRMCGLVPTQRHSLAVDLRLDATVALPESVAREVERAALILARVSAAPFGTAAWKAYHQRFYERFGLGSLVPVLDVVADSGIGFPDGYPESATEARRSPASTRDDALVRLAQSAALQGRNEVALDDPLIKSLELAPGSLRLPPHLEMGLRVHAADTADLGRGVFRIEVVSVSRGAGVGIGRFLNVLDREDRDRISDDLAHLPGADGNTVAAQLSFPPLAPQTAHVTRALQVLPIVISLGEHRAPEDGILTLKDLAVGCDGRRMYLAAPKLGRRIEAVGMHALNLHTHTPPLARLLIELSRAQCAQVTTFNWGAAQAMPFLPRLRYGRIILSPARWLLEASELPNASQPWPAWDDAFTSWRRSRRLPRQVSLTEEDRLLALDLDQLGHRVLLRAHLDSGQAAVLTEATRENGWCGGRAHEVVVPLKAVGPSPWPRLPRLVQERIIGRAQGQTPAASSVLLAGLYGDIRRQDRILTDHLPALLDRLGHPAWWYVRFRDPDQHLRLRIALTGPGDFGPVAGVVSMWADDLRHGGLLSEIRYPTSYPEMGRWGSGAAWRSAEEVFRADSRALLAQLQQPHRPHRRALVAAHSVAIAAAFLGSTGAGARWLIDNLPATAPDRIDRSLYNEAIRIADPRNDWAALREVAGGGAIVDGWADRERALTAYRTHMDGPDTRGIDPDAVLGSLLHVHFARGVAIDFPEEAICLYLARAAALAWTARTTGRAS